MVSCSTQLPKGRRKFSCLPVTTKDQEADGTFPQDRDLRGERVFRVGASGEDCDSQPGKLSARSVRKARYDHAREDVWYPLDQEDMEAVYRRIANFKKTGNYKDPDQ
jgi:hypothetical protein